MVCGKRRKISAGRLVRTRQTVGCPHVLTEGREKKHRSSAFGQKVQKRSTGLSLFAGDLKKEPEVR